MIFSNPSAFDDSLPHSDSGLLVTPSKTDRVIVKYRTSNIFSAFAVKGTLDLKSGVAVEHVRFSSDDMEILALHGAKDDEEREQVISQLEQDPFVEYAEPDLMLSLTLIPNDPKHVEQWHYYEKKGGINLRSAWDKVTGEGVTVAVIDSGYLPHSDLKKNIVGEYDMISEAAHSRDGDGRDPNAQDEGDWLKQNECGNTPVSSSFSSWHGTHVAGTIAALGQNNIGGTGVAFNAKILAVRAMGRCGGYTSDLADSIIWASGGKVINVPKNQHPAQVINLSLGAAGYCAKTMQAAIEQARNAGATIVVSAGNFAMNTLEYTPANCDGVIAVAATDRIGNKAAYSNYGSEIDVSAPGSFILSTGNTGIKWPLEDSYTIKTGTSMSASHVSGVAALLYAVSPGISPDEVEAIIKSTARDFPKRCFLCGQGIVDAAAVVEFMGKIDHQLPLLALPILAK